VPIHTSLHRASSSALAHLDGLLDEALEQTFPASDAVAIDIERESRDREARDLESPTLFTGNLKAGQRPAQKHSECPRALERVLTTEIGKQPR
jgi:hypothetical protein